MKINKEFILRQIGGDYVLIPVGDTIAQFNGLITINEVGAFLWKHLQNEITREELIQAVLSEYEIDRETVESDVDEFLNIIRKQNII